jgi:UDP-glucuronate decarboxylase
VSSGAVYGVQPAEISHIAENYTGGPNPINTLSAYGEGKRLAEQIYIFTKKSITFL